MFHGRLSYAGGATDEEGKELDDWGFTGPELLDVVGFHVTYGDMRVYFKNQAARDRAKEQTGWDFGFDEKDLDVPFPKSGDCLRIWNKARERYEYFGDWDFIGDKVGGCNG